MAEDLVVDLESVRAGAAEVRSAASRCEPVLPVLEGVAGGAPSGELAAATRQLSPWAREVQALSERAVRSAEAAVRACEELVATDEELGR